MYASSSRDPPPSPPDSDPPSRQTSTDSPVEFLAYTDSPVQSLAYTNSPVESLASPATIPVSDISDSGSDSPSIVSPTAKIRRSSRPWPKIATSFPTPPPSPDPNERSLSDDSFQFPAFTSADGYLSPQQQTSPLPMLSPTSNDKPAHNFDSAGLSPLARDPALLPPLRRDSLPILASTRQRKSSFQEALKAPARFISHGHKESLAIRNKPIRKSIDWSHQRRVKLAKSASYYLGPIILAVFAAVFVAQGHSPHHTRHSHHFKSAAHVASFSSHGLDFAHPIVPPSKAKVVDHELHEDALEHIEQILESIPPIPEHEVYDHPDTHVAMNAVGGRGQHPVHEKVDAVKDTAAIIPRNKIYLYRILGNDLPPRHRPGQTLTNLRFLLENEAPFANTEKVFVLNRIVDSAYERAIIALLDAHSMKYIRVPFILEDYIRQDFRLGDFPVGDFFRSSDFQQFSKIAKLRTIDYSYHDKNLYAMNNNGGRNIALEHGHAQADAEWIMPFDGNCFFTPNAFADMTNALHQNRDPYFVVPMARLLDNQQIFNQPDERPEAMEEPQIVFRHDANETYNKDMRYGRRSKLELLWRLGAIPSERALNKQVAPWESMDGDWAAANASFSRAGWVFRLFSGQALQEESKPEALSLRAYNRLVAIQDFLDTLDEKVARRHGFDSGRFFSFDATALNEARLHYWAGDEDMVALVDALVRRAYEVIDTWSVASLQRIFDEVSTLAFAYYFTGDDTFSTMAAEIIKTLLFHEHDVVMTFPVADADDHIAAHAFGLATAVPGSHHHTHAPNEDTPLSPMETNPALFLDAMRILKDKRILTAPEHNHFVSLTSSWINELVNSDEGIELSRKGGLEGTRYDVAVASLAAYSNDLRLFLRVTNWARMRLRKQQAMGLTMAHRQYWSLLAGSVVNTGAGIFDIGQHLQNYQSVRVPDLIRTLL